jgi:hypothetical protein
VPLLKRLSQLSVAILLFSVLAISFHYHGTLTDQRYCPLCKLAKSLSAVKTQTPPLLSGHICKTFHDLSAGELPASILLPLPEFARTAPVINTENCRRALMTHPVASRASPAMPPALFPIV